MRARKIETILECEAEKRRTVRYREIKEPPLIRFIYIPKDFLEGERPRFMKVQIEFVDEIEKE